MCLCVCGPEEDLWHRGLLASTLIASLNPNVIYILAISLLLGVFRNHWTYTKVIIRFVCGELICLAVYRVNAVQFFSNSHTHTEDAGRATMCMWVCGLILQTVPTPDNAFVSEARRLPSTRWNSHGCHTTQLKKNIRRGDWRVDVVDSVLQFVSGNFFLFLSFLKCQWIYILVTWRSTLEMWIYGDLTWFVLWRWSQPARHNRI